MLVVFLLIFPAEKEEIEPFLLYTNESIQSPGSQTSGIELLIHRKKEDIVDVLAKNL